jgi:tetratricopeptide (TPR) repeat protein
VIPELNIGEWVAMIEAGRYGELEGKLRGIIEQHPNSGLAWKALGVSLRMQGKDALHALQTAATLLPDDAEAHSNLGNARFDLGHLREAVASYGESLRIRPDFAEAHNNRGNALRGLGRLDAALASFHQALAIRPDFAEAHSNLGNALRSLGRCDEAVDCYRRALAIRPDDAAARNNLGNALLDLGQLGAAAASYRRALAIKPDFSAAHSNLGNALRGLGRFDEAVASYRRALSLDPQFAAAHSNLSDTLRDLGQLAAALASSRRAIEIDPQLAGAHLSLGNALLDLGRLDEAAAGFGRALELNPRFTAASINLGLVLRQQGKLAEAEASCRTALDTNPSSAPAMVLLAEIRADTGQFAQAEESFKRAVELDPQSAEGWAGIAHVRKMTANDAPWMAQALRIAERGLAPRQEAHIRFALGKFFDDVKDFDQAFANFRRANELTKRYGAPYDGEQITRTVDQLILRYDDEWANRTRIEGNASARPVFIVGMPRSGTTLAEQILASHPAVFGAGELTFWTAATSESVAAGGGPASRLAADYLRQLEGLSAGALRVVDKMPANFLSLGLIHDALPNAHIIHMRRNPIDTCLSIYFQDFRSAHAYGRDLDDLAHYYAGYVRLMDHWRRMLPEHTILDVPYERLVSDQEAWSRRMLEFIGVPWDPRCIDFQETNRSVMSASKWQVRQKMNRSSIERWRNYEKFVGPLRGLD